MRIVVDGGTWANRRGYGRFTREILSAASARDTHHAFTLVVDSSVAAKTVPSGIRIVRAPLGAPPAQAASATGRRSVRDLWRMSRALSAEGADCIFFPSVYTYVPVATRAPVVVCIHDVIPERLPAQVFPTRRGRLFWTLKMRAALRQAARVVTVSAHARAGLVEQFGLSAGAIRVVSEAPAAAFSRDANPDLGRAVLSRIGLPVDARFLLYVGGIAAHKNLIGLVDAVADLRRDPALADLVLVLVGDYTRDVFYSAYPDLQRRLAREQAGSVFLVGPLPDDAIAGLLRLTQALVLPSFDEGFGLPGIEAAACGAAVVATQNSALPTVLGDSALFFDPREAGALRRVLAQVLLSPSLRTALGDRAAERARDYTWRGAADQLLAVFDELVG